MWRCALNRQIIQWGDLLTRDSLLCPRRQGILPALGPVHSVVVVVLHELPSRPRSLGGVAEEPLVAVGASVVLLRFGARGPPWRQLPHPFDSQ